MNSKTLRGFEVIDAVKATVEKKWPGIVSCADIVAYASRDAAVFSGLRYYKITDVKGNLPTPIMTISEMTQIFTNKGMMAHDMVALTGSHSIRKLQCSFFDYRIYHYSGTGGRDPKLQPTFGNRSQCRWIWWRREGEGLCISFYKRWLERRSMLESDQVMAADTKMWVNSFTKAMDRLNRVDVITCRAGGIRKNCRAVNSVK